MLDSAYAKTVTKLHVVDNLKLDLFRFVCGDLFVYAWKSSGRYPIGQI